MEQEQTPKQVQPEDTETIQIEERHAKREFNKVPPLQCSRPLGRSRAKKPFLEKLLQPLGIFFYTLFLLQVFGWPEDM